MRSAEVSVSGRGGFGLVELLIALVIFSFGVLAGVALLGAGYHWEGRAELATQLTVTAEMKIEELKAVAGSDLPDTVQLLPGGDLSADVADHWDTVNLDGRVFRRRWTVEAGPAGTRKATVAVEPEQASGSSRAQLWTYVIQ